MAGTPITTELLGHLHPFAAVGGERLNKLLPLVHRERFAQSLDPFRQRDWTGQLIYLISGEIKVVQPDGVTRVLVGGSDRALFPIAQTGNMPVSGKAITDIEMLRIDEDASDIVVTWEQCVDANAESNDKHKHSQTNWRMMSGMFAVQNLTHGAFAALPSANIGTLLDRFERISFKRGEVVINQGDVGEHFFLIERGRAMVTRELAGTTIEVAELKAGDSFGEEALVSGAARNATVTMRTDGILLRLGKPDFDELLRKPLLSRCSVAEAVQRVASGSRWLDVRYPAEYQHDGLPGAINMPLNDVRQLANHIDSKTEYIVYCQTGRRSEAATFLLTQRGINAVLLEGGLRMFGGDSGHDA